MHSAFSRLAAALAVAATASVASAKDSRTFAVMHFHGDGPLTIGRTDPIVSPGKASSHVHHVQGGNAFGNSATGESMLKSTCSTANLAADKSAYWMPSLYFYDAKNNSFESVPMFYMNVYYFFEATNDKIEAFPVGLQMVSGNALKDTPPATGNDVLDPSQGTIQPAQFTCPRSSYNPPSYPPGSDGTRAGIQDTNNQGAGAGFPFAECDGYASPLRADLHFPSCYDPSQPLTAYKTNTAFPTDAGDGKQDCPPGWKHLPHLFYEMYWNTPLFADRWTPNEGSQPFVLANGDAAGYSLHGDFLAAWDTTVLQSIIDTCDAGDSGMDKCPGVETVLSGNCQIPNPTPEQVTGVLAELPGHNPLFGWQYGPLSGSDSAPTTSTTTSPADSAPAAPPAAASSAPPSSSSSSPSTGSAPAGSSPGSGAAGSSGSAPAGSSGSAPAGSSSSTSGSSPAGSSPDSTPAGPKSPAGGSPPAQSSTKSAPAVAVAAAAPSSSSAAAAAAPTAATSPAPAVSAPAKASAPAPAPPASSEDVTSSTVSTTTTTTATSTVTASPEVSSSSTSSTTAAPLPTVCPAIVDVSTTVVTIPVTVYSATTSTVYVTESASPTLAVRRVPRRRV
ncbi:wsc domain containing protein [Niveomyces insectorum RCEF 264]|uniref:Wsc domain containing protein n=1 Tax=Niveomyces insectorum RCEF 264 TaxID=1081102 RepID=A0A167REE0_9HYPO|nr:wsc domain containing protein [Niveomyces insectorum RCEF 264]